MLSNIKKILAGSFYFFLSYVISKKARRYFSKKLPLLYKLGTYTQLRSFAKPGDTVIQSGADMGWKHNSLGGSNAIKFSKIVGKNGKVIAIEPDERNIKKLKKYIEENNIKNIIPVEKALWNIKTKMQFNLGNRANDSLLNEYLNKDEIDYETHYKDEQIVEADTIDNILRDFNICSIAHICLTVNGAEFEALKGATATLSKNKLSLYIAAAIRNLRQDMNAESYQKEICAFLESYGFKTRIDSKGWIIAKN